MDQVDSGRWSDDEFKQFLSYFKWFCTHDLVRWEEWRAATPCGPVYAHMARSLPSGTDPTAFRSV